MKGSDPVDGSEVTFVYDALGRRVRKQYRGQTTHFVWDGHVPLHEWVEGALEPLAQALASAAALSDWVVKKREAELQALLAQGPPDRGSQAAPITWLFEPERFIPLAKLVGKQRLSIVTDTLGAPMLMTDDRGRAEWTASVTPEARPGLRRRPPRGILSRGRKLFMAHALTVTEVMALSGMEEGRIRKDVEYGMFGNDSPPVFNLAALIYFRSLALMDIQLTVEDRRKVYSMIVKALSGARRPDTLDFGPVLELKLAKVVKEVTDTLERFEAWKAKRVVINPKILGGEPVFSKSRLSIRHIGGLVLRDAVDEIREDYPYLSELDIKFAKLYALAYPKRGRPRERPTDSER